MLRRFLAWIIPGQEIARPLVDGDGRPLVVMPSSGEGLLPICKCGDPRPHNPICECETGSCRRAGHSSGQTWRDDYEEDVEAECQGRLES